MNCSETFLKHILRSYIIQNARTKWYFSLQIWAQISFTSAWGLASHLIYLTWVDWMRFDSNQLFKNKIKGAEGFEFLLVWLNPLNLVKYRVFRSEQQFYLKYSICRQATISITRMLRKAQLVILSSTSCFSSKRTKKQIEISYTAV